MAHSKQSPPGVPRSAYGPCDGLAASVFWDELVASAFAGATSHAAGPPIVLVADARTAERTLVDWPAYPVRIASCLSRRQACCLLDWQTGHGDEGRKRFQEEYAEWRVVRANGGEILKFELTTELPDYFIALAGSDPGCALALIAEFSHEDVVSPVEVYGEVDPFGDTVTDFEREAAFSSSMLGQGVSPYNDGRRAICCMRQPSNTLGSLAGLVVAAAGSAQLVRDSTTGLERCPNAAELIPLLGDAAVAGRNSDPSIAERVTRLAHEGRLIGFDGPAGVFISGVQLERLRQPDGTAVPAEWFTLSRDASYSSVSPCGPRYRRLTLQVPPDLGFCVGNLTDVATGRAIVYGAELAELVQLAVYLRTSGPGLAARVAAAPVDPPSQPAQLLDCAEIRQAWAQFEELQGG